MQKLNKLLLFGLLFILLLNMGYAIDTKQVAYELLTTSINDVTYRGMEIKIGQNDQRLVNVTLNKTSTATHVTIYNGTAATRIMIYNTSTKETIGNKITFKFNNVVLKARATYKIVPQAASGNVMQFYKGSSPITFPYNNTYLQWTNAIYWGGSAWSNDATYVWGLQSISVNTTTASPPATQTPTPIGLTNTSNGKTNITLSWTGTTGSKYLLYQNGTNVVNMTTKPYVRTGLTNNTRYGFKIKSYNVSYTTALSNFSNLLEVRTKQIISSQTPTPINFEYVTYDSHIFNMTLSYNGHYGSKYLIFVNGTNWMNTTLTTAVVLGLSANTRYGFRVKAYNTTYSTPLSEFTPLVEARTNKTPSVTLVTDIINYENYTISPFIFRFNGSLYQITNNSFDCTLKDNSTVLGTRKVVNITKKQNITFSSVDGGRTYNTTLACINNEINGTISRRFFFDSSIPVITLTQGVNNSNFKKIINTALPYIITYSDENLYKINTTLCSSTSGTVCDNVISNWHNTVLGDDVRVVNVTNLFSGLPDYQRWFIMAEAYDGHTKSLIDDYAIQDITIPSKDGLTKGAKIENAIQLTSIDVDSFDFVKNTDRYNFDVVLKKPDNKVITFDLKSTGNLTYLPKSDYKGHFIDLENGKWIDFENPNTENIDIVKVSDYEYSVIVTMKQKEEFIEKPSNDVITFNSIGDLNHIIKYYYFNITNPNIITTKDAISGLTIQNFSVVVYNPSTIIQSKSTTNGIMYLNLSGSYHLNVSGNVGGLNYVTETLQNYSFSNNSSLVVNLTLENSLYLFVYDEQTNALITDRNVTIDIINYQNESTTYTTDTGVLFQYGFNEGDYEINYKADNYTARSYYTRIVGSDTQQIELFLLSNLDATHQYLNYDIVDDSAVGLINATLKLQRYYISDNAWKTVEMSQTNDEGQGFIFAELYDVSYRFVVEYLGLTKKITSPSKLDTRDLLFSIALLDVGLTHYYLSGDVAASMVFDNDTKIYTYSYNAVGLSDVLNGRLLVSKLSETRKDTICNTTLTATSGGITCNLTSYLNDDSTFLAQGFLRFSGNNTEYLVSSDSMILVKNYLKYGMSGVYLGFIAIGTMAFIGLFSPVMSIVMGLFGLVITSAMGLIYLNYMWLVGIILVGIIYIYSVRQP